MDFVTKTFAVSEHIVINLKTHIITVEILFPDSENCRIILKPLRSRVRHIILVKLIENYAFLCHPKNRTVVPKIMLLSDHYARVMLVEISPLNQRYHPKWVPKQFNISVLPIKATKKHGISNTCEACQVLYVSNLVYAYLLLYWGIMNIRNSLEVLQMSKQYFLHFHWK